MDLFFPIKCLPYNITLITSQKSAYMILTPIFVFIFFALPCQNIYVYYIIVNRMR